MADEANTPRKPGSSWINLAVDYGPLLVFLLVYYLYSPEDKNDTFAVIAAVIRGTGAFIVAALAALAISKWRLGHVSRMLMLSTVLIVGFGGLTILLADPFWVQVKPTADRMGTRQGAAAMAARSRVRGAGRRRLAEAQPQLGVLLPGPGGAQRGAALPLQCREWQLRHVAVGQVLGVHAAFLPLHLCAAADAAEARPVGRRGKDRGAEPAAERIAG
jgi:hypothetical protein